MSNCESLTDFETAVLESIINAEAPEYISHIELLCVEKRENTGGGAYIDFRYKSDISTKKEMRTLGPRISADIEGIAYGADFVLCIDDGLITMLECICYGSDTWPEKIEKFKIAP